MSTTPPMPPTQDEWTQPSALHLDLRNPRVPDENFAEEDEVLEYLLENADVNELVQSIATSGWMDYEPLIVLRHDDDSGHDDVVLEGNRRLAALRLIADASTRQAHSVDTPTPINPNATPTWIRVRKVQSRNEARDFIGFKHINGPAKWTRWQRRSTRRNGLIWRQYHRDKQTPR